MNNLETVNLENNIEENMDLINLSYFNNKCLSNCSDENFIIKDFKILYDMINTLNLTTFQKNLILVRFRRINLYCIENFKSVSNFYTTSKLFIIVCGILNPSLLSIKFNNHQSNYYLLLFWTIWSLQLTVSLITSFISFYKWDKKYFLYSSYKSKINQEIWLYLELTGKYSDDNNQYNSYHSNKFNQFMERLEYLFRKLKNLDLEIENSDEDDNKTKNKKPNIDGESKHDLNELENLNLESSKL